MDINLEMTHSLMGLSALLIFALAYLLVMGEEFLHLRKSKPVVLAAGILWLLVAIAGKSKGLNNEVQQALKHNILEYANLLLFLLVAMTYINALEERNVFNSLKAWLVEKKFSFRQLFWITGIFAFFLSPIADNMTTALVMCAIIMAVGQGQKQFITLSCINIVIAANAGGAFSPFGDITTLMVWQAEILPFERFFHLFLPCVVNFLLPAVILHFALPKQTPEALNEKVHISPGGIMICFLFLLTIITAICFHQFLGLPPTLGMMTGLGYLQFFGYYLKKANHQTSPLALESAPSFDVFRKINLIEWDTLLFFYGVLLCVGALATFGYLHVASDTLYSQWGASLSEMHRQTPANVTIGIASAIVDNIPIMFAVLTMNPTMSDGQWLLITLTAGVGGSLLSIGSAAGVALMGQSKGNYTFFSHLKWSWVVLLGYIASIICHFWINKSLFHV